jgi:hypothetical protein
MPIIVKKNNSTVKIRVKNVDGVLVGDSAPTLTLGAIIGSASRLDELTDVVESSPEDNSTLVYDETTDKYIVKPISVDGGEF